MYCTVHASLHDPAAPRCPLLRIRAPGRAARPSVPRALETKTAMHDRTTGRQDIGHTGRPDSQGSFLFPFRRYYFHRLRREGQYAACTQPRIDAVCWVPPHIISRYIQTLTVHGRHDIHIKTRHISPAPWRSACCGLPHMTHHIRSLIRGPLRRPAATGSRVVVRSPTPAGSPARRRASRPRDVFGSYSTAT